MSVLSLQNPMTDNEQNILTANSNYVGRSTGPFRKRGNSIRRREWKEGMDKGDAVYF